MTSLRWQERGDATAVIVTDDGRHLADYSWSTAQNHPFFSHVRPLQHDGVLTNTAPWDHRWHHGLWWSWKFIDGVLFWEDHPDYGNGTGALGRSWVTGHEVTVGDAGIRIDETLAWRPDGSDQALLTEVRRITAHTALDGVDAWALDWDSTWTANAAVELSVTPYPEHWWGGYAGLNYRAARSMSEEERILASGGRLGRETVHSHEGQWAALLGNVDGAGTDEPNRPAYGGAAILVHPENGPTPLYVFSAADEFGFLATAPLMHGSRQLARGETLRLRHRVVVLGHDVDHETLDRLSRAYGGKEHLPPT
ncbi:DUF6807 family protein [Microbacterium timonense]|uniref:DUF6807 family protein n=1 Tax=Microbacterium timonense TaxID=2086576 RepID=UPI00135B8887|nr:DUF6807 family protein [Microbacterium timonense]